MNSHLAQLKKETYTTFDGDEFGYRHWLPEKEEPELVIIGIHGISGASLDYRPVSSRLVSEKTKTAIYAAETRGQGNDPVVERRGHIPNRQEWFNDLYTFTNLVRKKHPKAKIVWCGESMGSLIAAHAFHNHPGDTPPCDALVLSSPIVGIKGDFPKWKEVLVKITATVFPKMRLSLETLSGEKETRVTKDSVHQEQTNHNPYHIKRHTLRLLSTLGDMAQKMPEVASGFSVPTLVLHGGNDVFCETKKVEDFVKKIPNADYQFYPKSYHLLFYDHERDRVIGDIGKWLNQL